MKCSLVFQNPMLPTDAAKEGVEGGDPLLNSYFEIMRRYKTEIPERPDPFKHNKLKDIYGIKKSGRLLDVGCSVGDFMHLAKHFYQVEGVEINPLTAHIARQHFTVHEDYLDKLALGPVFDIVTLNQILYGVADPLSLMKDVAAVLKPGGIVYLNTPNADSYASQHFRGSCCHYYGYTTLNVFNIESLEFVAENAGLRLLSARTEWLDIYTPDIIEFYESPTTFVHKRNCHRPSYEEQIIAEDQLHAEFNPELKGGGNYIVAILAKDHET